jgi:hypothetical protein
VKFAFSFGLKSEGSTRHVSSTGLPSAEPPKRYAASTFTGTAVPCA